MKKLKLVAALALVATTSAAFAHGGHGGSRGGEAHTPSTTVSTAAATQPGTKTLDKADVPVASDAAQNALYSH